MDEELHPDELTEEEIEGVHKLERSLETMQEKIDRQADVIKNMSEHYSKAVVKEYERGLAEAQARMELAVEEGDVEAYKAAKAEADSLMENASTPQIDQEGLQTWMKANPWYETQPRMGKYAFECGEYLAKTKPHLTQEQQLAEIRSMVEEEFSDYFSNPNRQPGDIPRGARQHPRGARVYSNLPPEAQAHCDQYCAELKVPDGKGGMRPFTVKDYLASYNGPWGKQR